MIKKKIFCLWAAALILSGCAGVFQGKEKEPEPDFVLTYAENQAEDYPTTQGADKFAELVKEKPKAKLRYWSMQAEAWEMKNLSLNSCSLVVLILPEYPFLR